MHWQSSRSTLLIMDAPGNNLELHLYPIQLQEIGVRELSIIVVDPTREVSGNDIRLEIGHAPLTEENVLSVRARASIGMDDEEANVPCRLRVELVAKFLVNTSEFPVDQVDHWARFNAMFILYPYLREHIYSLTLRTGIRTAILPLLEAPTYSIARNDDRAS